MVIDPNLIPQYVDVVIGDYLYELQFRVEENVDANNPEPMDMEQNDDNGGKEGEGDKTNDQMDTDITAAKKDNGSTKELKGGNDTAVTGAKQARQVIHLTIPSAIPPSLQEKALEDMAT